MLYENELAIVVDSLNKRLENENKLESILNVSISDLIKLGHVGDIGVRVNGSYVSIYEIGCLLKQGADLNLLLSVLRKR